MTKKKPHIVALTVKSLPATLQSLCLCNTWGHRVGIFHRNCIFCLKFPRQGRQLLCKNIHNGEANNINKQNDKLIV